MLGLVYSYTNDNLFFRRPTTGKVNLNPIIAKNLLTKKAELIGKIKLVREESAEIEQFFKGFSDQINAQLEEIDSLEKKYANN